MLDNVIQAADIGPQASALSELGKRLESSEQQGKCRKRFDFSKFLSDNGRVDRPFCFMMDAGLPHDTAASREFSPYLTGHQEKKIAKQPALIRQLDS